MRNAIQMRMAPFRSLLIVSLVAVLGSILAGCGGNKAEQACRAIRFEGDAFTVCDARPGRDSIRLVDRDKAGVPLRGFDRLERYLGKLRPRLSFAMNAGMYDARGLPIGLYVEDERPLHKLVTTDGPGNFNMKPNGVFYGDASGWHVATSDAFAARKPGAIRFATQSGPMLMIAGRLHPRISNDGPSINIRNGVGIGADGSARFVISNTPVSFGKLARLFRDRLDCRDALYLDGAVSRLWDPANGRRDDGVPIGPIVVVLQKR